MRRGKSFSIENDECGCSDKLFRDQMGGISEIRNAFLFPNPADDHIQVNLKQRGSSA
jgi:hypothetical protein